MIAIKDMKMPKSCIRCQVSDSVPDCPCKGNTLILDYRDNRHPDCPLIEIEQSEDCVSRQAVLEMVNRAGGSSEFYGIFERLTREAKALPPVAPARKAPREDITEDEVKINMLELAFNQVKEHAEGIEIITDKYRLIFKAEKRGNKVGWSSLENVREKVERGNSDDSN